MSPTDPSPTAEALGRENERLTRRVDELEATHSQKLDALADMVDKMGQAVGELLQPRSANPQSWFLVSDRDEARGMLADLLPWLDAVYLRFPGTELRDCWSRHPEVVEELCALRYAHAEALSGRGWAARLVQWHSMSRPSVVDRIRSMIGTCDLTKHVSGGQTPIAAPGAAHLDAIADHWVTHGVPPEPTEQELQQAAEYSDLLLNRASS